MSCCLATVAVSGRRQMCGGRTDVGQNSLKSSGGSQRISNKVCSCYQEFIIIRAKGGKRTEGITAVDSEIV